ERTLVEVDGLLVVSLRQLEFGHSAERNRDQRAVRLGNLDDVASLLRDADSALLGTGGLWARAPSGTKNINPSSRVMRCRGLAPRKRNWSTADGRGDINAQ